nr:hypothetical protein [Tanacetum cinerariifolium]
MLQQSLLTTTDFALDIPTDCPTTLEMVNATKDNFDEGDLVKFQELLLDTEKPLYEGCPDFTEFSAIVKLLNLKSNEYHKYMETIGIPPDKHESDENKEGKPLSAGKSSAVYAKLFQKVHLRHKQVLKTENPGKRIAFLENEHSKSFAKWLRKEVERELAISKETVYQKVGVSVEEIDLHIYKEVATTRQAFYYGVLQEIWVLDYRFRKIPIFKCDWVNHGAGGVKRDNLGYTLVDLSNLDHKVDPFILASQAR